MTPPHIPDPHTPPLQPPPAAVPAAGAPAGNDPAALAQRVEASEKLAQELQRQLQQLVSQLQDLQDATARGLKGVASAVTDMDVDARVDPFGQVFVAKVVAGDTAGLFKFKEQTVNGSTTLADFTDGRSCNSFSDASALVEINGWKDMPADSMVLVVESEDLDDHRYHGMIGVPPPPDRTKNYILRYSGTDKKMVWVAGTVGQGGTIQSSSGGPVVWSYSVQLDDGTTVTAKNGFETVAGAPGKLGIHVDSDGTVTGTSCVVQAIGDGAYVWCWQDGTGQWWFSDPDSAETP